jgi:hypothetical protein
MCPPGDGAGRRAADEAFADAREITTTLAPRWPTLAPLGEVNGITLVGGLLNS